MSAGGGGGGDAGGVAVRGDVHVLLVGDPGMGEPPSLITFVPVLIYMLAK